MKPYILTVAFVLHILISPYLYGDASISTEAQLNAFYASGSGTGTLLNDITLTQNATPIASIITLNGGTGPFKINAGNFTAINTVNGVLFLNPNIAFTSSSASSPTCTIGNSGSIYSYSDLNFSQAGTIDLSRGTLRIAYTPAILPNNITNSGSPGGTFTFDGVVTLSGNISSNGFFSFSGTNTATITGAVTNGSTLTASGGTLALAPTVPNTNSYQINISDIFQAGNSQAISPNATLLFSGGTFSLGGYDVTLSNIIGSAGTISLGANTLTLDFDTDLNGFGVAINGTGGVTKSGSGLVSFSGNNKTYSGLTTVAEGTLVASSAMDLPSNSTMVLANAASAILNTTPASVTVAGLSGGGNLGGTLSFGGQSFTFGGNNVSTSFSGIISGSGSFIKTGTGTFTLNGAQTYSATTTVNGGVFKAGGSNLFSPNSTVSLANTSGVILDLNNFNSAIGALSGGGSTGGTVLLGSNTLTLGGNNANTTFSGTISGSGTINKTGTGTFTLSGTPDTWGLQIAAGTVSTAIGNIGSGGIFFTGASTLQLTDSSTLSYPISMSSSITATINNSSNYTISSQITGDGTTTFTKTGAGSLTLTNVMNSSYSWATNVTAGSLILPSLDTVGTGVLTIGTGAAFQLNSGTLLSQNVSLNGTTTLSLPTITTISANLSVNNGSIVFDATSAPSLTSVSGTLSVNNGTATFNAATSLAISGTVSVNNGTATFSPATSLFLSGDVNLSNNGTLALNPPNPTSITGNITGAGNVSTTGVVTFTPASSNTYTGTTTITSGTVRPGNANGISPNTTINIANVSGATFDLNGLNVAVAGLSGGGTTGGTVSLGSNTLSVGGSSTSSSYGGSITGTGGLTKTGSGNFSLTGTNNTYSGTTTINAGGLYPSAGSLSPNSEIVITSGFLGVNGNNTILGITASPGATSTAILFNATATLTIGSDGLDSTITGQIRDNGGSNGSLIKVGAGTLFLTATSTPTPYRGTTTINSGAIVGNGGGLSSNSSFVLANTSGVFLRVAGTNIIQSISGGGSNGGNLILDANLTLNGASSTTTYAGKITGTGGLTVAQNLTLTNTTSDYTGNTTVNRILQAGANNAFSPNSGVLINNTFTLSLNGFSATVASIASATTGILSLGSGTLTFGGNNLNTNFTGTISGTGGSLVKTGTGIFTLIGTNKTYTGTTTVNQGTFRAANIGAFSSSSAVVLGSTAGTLDLNGFNNTIASLAGGGSEGGGVSLGAGTLTMGSNNSSTSFMGQIQGTGGITKVGSGTFTLFNSSTNYSGRTTISAGTVRAGAANSFSKNSQVSLPSAGTLNLNNFNNEILSLVDGSLGTLTLGTGVLTLGGDGTTFSFPGLLSGTGGITKTGAGNFTLSNTMNLFSGALAIRGGAINIGASGALPLSSSLALDNVAGAQFNLNNFNHTTGALSGGGALGGNILLGSATLTSNTTESSSYAGVISGTGNFIKTGAGTLTLTGNNLFTGNTTINGGALSVTPTSGVGLVSPITVNATGTLKGNGSVGASVVVHTGGTISPGNSIGTLTVLGDLTLDAGSITHIELSPTDSSQIIATGNALIDGILNVTVDAGLYSAGSIYPIVTGQTGLSGSFSSNTFTPSLSAIVFQQGNSIFIQIPFAAGSISLIGLTGNELITAEYLNALPISFLDPISEALGGLEGTQLQDALQTISPSRLSFATYVAQNAAISVNGVLSQRMNVQRSHPVFHEFCCAHPSQDEYEDMSSCNRHYTAWIEQYGNWSKQNAQAQNPHFYALTGATILGFDFAHEKDFSGGFVAGFVYSSIHDAAAYGTQSTNNYLWGIYGSTVKNEIFIEGAFWTGYNRISSDRKISYTDYYEAAHSKFNGWQLSPHLKIGVDVQVDPSVVIQPYLALDWPIFFQGKYQENETGIFSMKVNEHASSFCQFTLGYKSVEVLHFDCFSLMMQQSVEYIHRAPFGTGTVTAALIGAPSDFTTYSLIKDQNLLAGSLDFMMKNFKNYYVNLNLSAEGGSGYTAFEAYGGLGFEF